MTKTLVDIDDRLLTKAPAALGTTTKKETVNEALREAVRITAIQEYLQALGIYERAVPGLVLADASALVRCAEPEVGARLLPLLVLGDLTTCAAVKHELSSWNGGPATSALAALRRVELHWLPTNDADLARASEIQTELTQQGQPQLPWTRLVIAAVAVRYEATVLHYASDYDLIAKVTGQDTDWIAPPGTLPERPTEPPLRR